MTYEINLLTADPILRLMLAEAGYETFHFPFDVAWRVFAAYLTVDSVCEGDHASFEAETVEDGTFFARFTRELRDSQGDAIAVVLESYWESERPDHENVEIWTDDYESLEEYLDAVSSHPVFLWAMQREAIEQSGLYVVYPDE